MSSDKTYKILIVEDNEMNLALVKEILSMQGYSLLEAYDGFAGVNMTIGALPDVVLMDVNLPELDGISAMKKIKATDSIKDIPVIALTASAMKGDDSRFLSQGFDGYVAKPISMNQLLEEVERVLGINN